MRPTEALYGASLLNYSSRLGQPLDSTNSASAGGSLAAAASAAAGAAGMPAGGADGSAAPAPAPPTAQALAAAVAAGAAAAAAVGASRRGPSSAGVAGQAGPVPSAGAAGTSQGRRPGGAAGDSGRPALAARQVQAGTAAASLPQTRQPLQPHPGSLGTHQGAAAGPAEAGRPIKTSRKRPLQAAPPQTPQVAAVLVPETPDAPSPAAAQVSA